MKKLMFAIAVAAASAAMAEVSFSYQGALKTATGENIPPEQSNKVLSFRLYETPTGPDAIWGRALAVHLDANGLFNVELSDTAGSPVSGSVKTNVLDAVLSKYSNLYIGLDVEGSTGEIRPRQKLINVPTAAFAADVSKAKNDFTVDGGATFRGAVTAKSSMTVAGKLTADDGVTVSKGGLTVSGGGLSVSGGGLSIGAGITIDPTGDTGKGIIPRGVIAMWSGAAKDIPKGWALCDGTDDTPDLRGRFIVGASANGEKGTNADQGYRIGDWGGESFHKLNKDEIPKHTHHLALNTHILRVYDELNSDRIRSETGFDDNKKIADGGWDVKENDSQQNAHENRPPYYALCFIMKR